MAISIVKREGPSVPEIEYPCIMKSVLTGIIIGFTEPGQGSVLEPAGKDYVLWEYIRHLEMSNFGPYTGTIEYSNK